MALPTPFAADSTMHVLRPETNHISTPAKDFDHLGALEKQGETEGDFDDFCRAIRIVNDAVENDPDLAEQIAVLLNRAYAHGLNVASKG